MVGAAGAVVLMSKLDWRDRDVPPEPGFMLTAWAIGFVVVAGQIAMLVYAVRWLWQVLGL